MKMKRILFIFGAIFLTATVLNIQTIEAQVSTGGAFTLEQTVIAAGGANSTSGAEFTITGTIGQPFTGNGGQAAPFAHYSGFWTPPTLAPTAALVSIGGRITDLDERGIRNVGVSLTGADGVTRFTRSGTFGLYNFEGVAVGEIYILTVSSNRYTFKNPTQVVNVTDSLSNLDFTAVNSY
jgi:hypothetical protein